MARGARGPQWQSPTPSSLVIDWAHLLSDWNAAGGGAGRRNDEGELGRVIRLNAVGATPSRLLGETQVGYFAHIDDDCTLGCSAAHVQGELTTAVDALRSTGFVGEPPSQAGAPERYRGYASQATPARWMLPTTKLATLDSALAHPLTVSVVDVGIPIVGVLN